MKGIKSSQFEAKDLEEIAKLIAEYLEQHSILSGQQWVNEREAMALMGINSKTSVLKLRQQGKLRYSMILSKNIMYDRKSILELLNAHAREKF